MYSARERTEATLKKEKNANIFVAEKRRRISGNENHSREKHMTWMPNPL